MKENNVIRLRRYSPRSERGHSDFGIVMWILVITAGISFTMMFMGWIKSINHRRHGLREVPVDYVDPSEMPYQEQVGS